MPGNIVEGGFFDKMDHLDQHAHSKALVFPSAAAPIALTASATAWVGWASTTKYEVLASAAAPATPFDIHWAIVSGLSANGNFEIGIFAGPAGSEVLIATVPAFKSAVFTEEGSLPTMTPRQRGGTRISAALRGSNAVADTCNLVLAGHAYTH